MKKAMTVFLAVLMAGSMAVTGLAQESTEQVTESADASELVASEDEMIAQEEVVSEGMVPVYADSLKEGTYPIEVLSSSSMFRIVACELTVKDGAMTAAVTLSSDGYLKLFPGTGEEAVAADESEYITFELNDEGKQVYEVPVEALDMGIDCAAWSKRKEKWYDRVLVFEAASLPQEALGEGVFVTAEDLGLEDGAYQVDVTLEGGSGRTTVESPAALTVADGQATATIIFSSPNYDYMLVDGERYEPVNTEGNSTFEIPVASFDWKNPVTADTVAMSTPHEIDYTLYFDSATITKAE